MKRQTVTIINKLGLHARAAAKFVSTSSNYQSEVQIGRQEDSMINGKSIMAVMMLAASQGTRLILTVEGDDEDEAMQAICDLINDCFGEGE